MVIERRHAKRDLRTCAKSVDPDQPLRLWRSVWSGSALFDNCHISGTYISCCINNWITCNCVQYRLGSALCPHYLKCPKVPFRATLAIIKDRLQTSKPNVLYKHSDAKEKSKQIRKWQIKQETKTMSVGYGSYNYVCYANACILLVDIAFIFYMFWFAKLV